MKDWYKDSVFYEVPVKSFFDADGNGVGDLAGLTVHLAVRECNRLNYRALPILQEKFVFS